MNINKTTVPWTPSHGDDATSTYNSKSSNYVTPDDIWNDTPQITFIYNQDHTLYTKEGNMTHTKMIFLNPKYYGLPHQKPQNIQQMQENLDAALECRLNLLSVALIGRIGSYEKNHYISFWNTDPKVYRTLYDSCLQSLKSYMTPNTIIQTPLNDDVQNQDTEKMNKIMTHQQLHLMDPVTKKQKMKSLGLNPNSNKNAWQKQAEQERLIQPGQKWWATTSEDFQIKLDNILR